MDKLKVKGAMEWLKQKLLHYSKSADNLREIQRLLKSQSDDLLDGSMTRLIESVRMLTWDNGAEVRALKVLLACKLPNVDQLVVALTVAVKDIDEDETYQWSKGLEWNPVITLGAPLSTFMTTQYGTRIPYSVVVERLANVLTSLLSRIAAFYEADQTRFRYYYYHVEDLLKFSRQVLNTLVEVSDQHHMLQK